MKELDVTKTQKVEIGVGDLRLVNIIESRSENPIRNPESLLRIIETCRDNNAPVPLLVIICPNWSIDEKTGQRSIAPIDGENQHQKLGMIFGTEIPSLMSLLNNQGLAVHLTTAVSDIFDNSWMMDVNKAREGAIQNLKAVKTIINRFGFLHKTDWNPNNRGNTVLHSELMKKTDGFRLLEQLQLEAKIDDTPMAVLFREFRDFFIKIGEYGVLIPKGNFAEMTGQDLERLRKNFNKWLERVNYLTAQYAVDGLLAERFVARATQLAQKDEVLPIAPITLNVIATEHGLAAEHGWDFLRKTYGMTPLPVIRLFNNGIEHNWNEPFKEPVLFDK